MTGSQGLTDFWHNNAFPTVLAAFSQCFLELQQSGIVTPLICHADSIISDYEIFDISISVGGGSFIHSFRLLWSVDRNHPLKQVYLLAINMVDTPISCLVSYIEVPHAYDYSQAKVGQGEVWHGMVGECRLDREGPGQLGQGRVKLNRTE